MTEYAIPFTQYLLPNGERREMLFNTTDEDLHKKSREIRKAGYNIEIETLSTGEIHMDVCDDEDQIAARVCPNGHPVPDNVKELIDEAHQKLFAEATNGPS